MADAWLPRAGRLHSRHNGDPLQGGAPRAVWHTSENDPLCTSARSVAERLEQRGRNAHVVWNPFTGEIVQMVPATQAAQLLPESVGREGRSCLQIVVVGFAREPFTGGPMEGIEAIVNWLDTWQVARRWPAGEPLAPPEAYAAEQDRRSWARGGHFGVSQVPYGPGPAPGAIDIERITGHGRPAELSLGEVTLPAIRAANLMPAATVPGRMAAAPVPSPVGRHEPAHVRASSPT